MELEQWLAFASVALIATLIPGPAMLLVTSHSLANGPLRALATIVGNLIGLTILSALSVVGLSALIIHSFIAFTMLKLIGACYLIYIGINLWRNGVSITGGQVSSKLQKRHQLFFQGIIMALSNPKAILFTTALFPQFIQYERPIILQFVIFTVTFVGCSFMCLFSTALLAGKSKRYLSVSNVGTRIGRVFGGLFIGVGAMLALSVKTSS